jgi:hypothetical protein
LKKRSKKLISICVCGQAQVVGIGPIRQIDKSLFASFSSEKEDFSLS